MTFDVLAVGMTTLDIVASPVDSLPAEDELALLHGIELVPAGTAAGFALVAAKLGLRTRLAGAVGSDRAGRFVRTILAEQGVATDHLVTIPGIRTSTTILPIDSEGRRKILHALGASMLFELDEPTIAAASTARFIHWAAVGGPRIDPAARDRFFAAARAAGATMSCDLILPGPETRAELAEILPAIDYFMPSLAEARALTGHSDPENAAAQLRDMGAKNCVIKLGGDGALIADAAGLRRIPAFDITPVDTTSCGDAFCAGFIAGLAQAWPVDKSARFAAATAALVAGDLGTLGSLQDHAHTAHFAATTKTRGP